MVYMLLMLLAYRLDVSCMRGSGKRWEPRDGHIQTVGEGQSYAGKCTRDSEQFSAAIQEEHELRGGVQRNGG